MRSRRTFISAVLMATPITLAAAPSDHFVTTWKTDNPGTSGSTYITIPTTGTGYNYDVDWDNDGVFDELGITGDVTHDFGAIGVYTIRIQGSFPRINFNNGGDRRKILTLNQWGTGNWASMANAFYGANNLIVRATDVPDLSSVTNIGRMFSHAISANPNTALWDVSTVTNMSFLFYRASSADPDTSTWDVSSVTDMSGMFGDASSANPDTSSWDVSAVTSMRYVFNNADFAIPDTSAWKLSSVTNMTAMFANAALANPDTSAWDVSAVTTMRYMFANANSANPDTSAWDVSSVTDMTGIFAINSSANPDTSAWDVSSVTDMNDMFYRTLSANPDTSAWDVSSVTNMSGMFQNAISANPETGSWDVSSVTDMSSMFADAFAANPDTSSWNVSAVTDMAAMFRVATSANPDTSAWDVSSVTDMSDMFIFTNSANPDTSSWDVSSVTDMRGLFAWASSANPDTSSWDVSSVTDMSFMFSLSNLSTENYNALLINWNALDLRPDVPFHAGETVYCSVAAKAARENILVTHNWSISDGGLCTTPQVGWNILVDGLEGFKDCQECPLMIDARGGTYDMGDLSSTGNSAELPIHSVTLPDFAVGVYEVTFDQWDACFAASGCSHNPSDYGFGRGKRPVIDVNWDDVQEYLLWLSNITGKNYRLPSEAEWEYAARAGTDSVYYLGNTIDCLQARFVEIGNPCDSSRTLPVGSYAANFFGLHDMHGNVSEWVQDCWNDSYIGAPVDGSAWLTGVAGCGDRVYRSGGWNDQPYNLRSSYRSFYDLSTRRNDLGFRVVVD